MFQGVRTVIYAVSDIEKAKEWYTQVLAQPPHYAAPFYVGFRLGAFELGLDPDLSGVTAGNNAIAYWGVADARAAQARLLGLGAREVSPVEEVTDGVFVGRVKDPFGNVLGIIQKPMPAAG